MTSKDKISVITLGCSKNIVDSERLLNQLKINNFVLTEEPGKAETVIINTCGFIEEAKQESIDTILNAVELKNQGKLKKVIVAGCLSERYMDELKKEIPNVDAYFGTEKYSGILSEMGGELKKELLGERLINKVNLYDSSYALDLSGFKDGVYFVKVFIQNRTYNFKILKQ